MGLPRATVPVLRTLTTKENRMSHRIEKDFLGEKQIPDGAYYGVQTLRGQGELPHHRHPDVDRALLRQGLRLRQEGRRARQPRPRRARREGRQRDRCGLRPADRRRDARPVRHRLHPGRCRHLDQHERERGDRQPRARAARPQEGRVPVRQPERPRELRAVDERHLPDRIPARADPAARQLHGSACASCRRRSSPRARNSRGS